MRYNLIPAVLQIVITVRSVRRGRGDFAMKNTHWNNQIDFTTNSIIPKTCHKQMFVYLPPASVFLSLRNRSQRKNS